MWKDSAVILEQQEGPTAKVNYDSEPLLIYIPVFINFTIQIQEMTEGEYRQVRGKRSHQECVVPKKLTSLTATEPLSVIKVPWPRIGKQWPTEM